MNFQAERECIALRVPFTKLPIQAYKRDWQTLTLGTKLQEFRRKSREKLNKLRER
jgi:hypothetical protein